MLVTDGYSVQNDNALHVRSFVLVSVRTCVTSRSSTGFTNNRPTLTDNNSSVYHNQYKEQSTYMNIC